MMATLATASFLEAILAVNPNLTVETLPPMTGLPFHAGDVMFGPS